LPHVNVYTSDRSPLQFGLSEIILFVTALAVAFWSHDRTMVYETTSLPDVEFWQAVQKFLSVTLMSLKLFCLMLVLKELGSGRRFVWRRGKVFLCAFGVGSVISIAGSFYIGFPRGHRIVDVARLLPQAHMLNTFTRCLDVMIVYVAIFTVFMFAAWKIHRGKWRLAFGSILLPMILAFLVVLVSRIYLYDFVSGEVPHDSFVGNMFAFAALIQGINMIAAIVLLWCCFTDQVPGDWKHWLGIFLFLLDLYAFKFLEFIAAWTS